MGKHKILAVDDEHDILELINFTLSKEGYKVIQADSGDKAFVKAKEEMPDLIILDLMLPNITGLDVCKSLKKDSQTQHIPVIMLTAKTEESDIVIGLELGADDYITKPFSPRVLAARVKAVLRRKTADKNNEADLLKIHEILIHNGRHEVFVDGKPVDLTYTEFNILRFLAKRPGWVFTRYQIVDAVRGEDYPVTERSVDVQIVGLRKKLGDYGKYIQTVRGVGYKFQE
ncbi:response regulator [bacterium]|nr:response regulator [bacterium]